MAKTSLKKEAVDSIKALREAREIFKDGGMCIEDAKIHIGVANAMSNALRVGFLIDQNKNN